MVATAKHSRSIPLAYAQAFAELRDTLPGAGLPWLGALRDAAIARFQELGLPTRRVEDWKYTDLQPLAKLALAPSSVIEGEDKRIALAGLVDKSDGQSPRLVFVNGRLNPKLSTDFSTTDVLPDGARVLGLAQALAETPEMLEGRLGRVAALNGQAVAALNTAFMADGCLIHLAKGCALDAPIHLIFVAAPHEATIAYHPRIVIVADAGSEGVLIERHLGHGQGAYWTNPVTEIDLAAGAQLRHYKLQAESANAWHIALTMARLEAASAYRSLLMTAGGGVVRNEIDIALAGEGAECRLDGGYMLRGRDHVDNTTRVAHQVPHCISRQLYKGVLDGKSHGVFQGRTVVHRDAQKSDGHQLSQALLLSQNAEIDAKPELEIYADDVKCGHGAAAGALDDDQLFYLRSRGIDEAAARALLIEAFMTDLLEDVPDTSARDMLGGMVSAWLADQAGDAEAAA